MSIYTPTGFYQEQLAAYAPGEDADKHLQLAEGLMRLRDYERAGSHLERATELGNSRQPGVLRGKIEQLALYKEAAAAREHIDRIAALHDATGVWFDSFPLTPDRVLAGLRAAR